MTIYKIDCIFVIPDCRFLYKNRCKTKFVTFLTETEAPLTSHFSLLTSHLGMQIILSFGRGRDRKLKRCCFLLYYKLCYCSNYWLDFVQVILLLAFAITILVQNYFVCKLSHLFHTYVIGCVPSRLRFHRY